MSKENEKFILFGGGNLLCELAIELRKYSVIVVTSERHLREMVSTTFSTIMSLKDFLGMNLTPFIVSDEVNSDERVAEEITEGTIGISFGAAWIFKKDFISKFKGKLFNVHGSRLPQDRGGGGHSWRILRNERIGYCMIHLIDEGVDTGDIVAYKEFFYPNSCRVPCQYDDYLKEEYLKFLDKFIQRVLQGETLIGMKQPEYMSTYWPRLSTDIHGYIDWNWKLDDIEKFICAFGSPYTGASTFVNIDDNGPFNEVKIKRAVSMVNDGTFHPFQKGIIYRVNSDALFVATEDGSLVIQEVSDDRTNDIFSRLKVGYRFHTPNKYLEKAKFTRVIYDAHK